MSFGANSSFPYSRSGEAGHHRSVRNGMRTESDEEATSRIMTASRTPSDAANTGAATMQQSKPLAT